MILLKVLMKRTLDFRSGVLNQPSVTHQDTQTGGQELLQEQMTAVINKIGTVEGGTGESGQEIIKMCIGDIHPRGKSLDPGVLQEITETQIFDSETDIETFKMIG